MLNEHRQWLLPLSVLLLSMSLSCAASPAVRATGKPNCPDVSPQMAEEIEPFRLDPKYPGMKSWTEAMWEECWHEELEEDIQEDINEYWQRDQ